MHVESTRETLDRAPPASPLCQEPATAATAPGSTLAENRTGGIKTGWRSFASLALTSTWRIPGDFEQREYETAEGDEIHRYYDPSIGRYLQPDPLWQRDPKAVRRAAFAGRSENPYSYAANNPLAFADPFGLYTVGPGCTKLPPGVSVEETSALPDELDVLEYATRISDNCLRDCVVNQVLDGHVECDTWVMWACKHTQPKNTMGWVRGDEIGDPGSTVKWCKLKSSVDCNAQSIAHEMAHLCGWTHGDGKGVPGDDGCLCGTCEPQ